RRLARPHHSLRDHAGQQWHLGRSRIALAIGLVAPVIGLVALTRCSWQRTAWPHWIPPILITAWSCAWLMLHDFPGGFRHIAALATRHFPPKTREAVAAAHVT